MIYILDQKKSEEKLYEEKLHKIKFIKMNHDTIEPIKSNQISVKNNLTSGQEELPVKNQYQEIKNDLYPVSILKNLDDYINKTNTVSSHDWDKSTREILTKMNDALLKQLNEQMIQITNNNQFSSLDNLLNGKEKISHHTPPIFMPTDLLFAYNSDILKLEATEILNKLGLLIQKNPSINCIIEGYTDSFGSDEYNQDLSLKRAISVKKWLEEVEKIPSNKMQTIGYGKKKLLISGNKSIVEQSMNRRVEIVISLDEK